MENKFLLLFHPEAEKEYLDSVAWYEDALIGLVQEFVAEIENTFDHISKNPFLFPVRKFNLREAVVKKFPFVIVFTINQKQGIVTVLSVYHTSRNPRRKYRK